MIITACISIIVLIIGWYFLRSFKESGLCLAVVWSSYATEQLFQSKIGWFQSHGSAFNIGVGCFVFLAIVYLLLSGKVKSANLTTTAALYYALLGWACLTYVWSIDQHTTYSYLKSSAPYMVVFAILSPYLIRSPKDLIKCANGTIILGAFVLLGHAFTEFDGRSIRLRLSSTEELGLNPLAVASLGGVVIICTAFWIYQNRKARLLRLLIAGAIIALGLYTIVRSGSRGQLLATVVALLIWIPITARTAMKRGTILALLSAVGIALGSIYMIDKLGWSGSWEVDRIENSFSGRLNTASSALDVFVGGTSAQWLIGQGSSSSWISLGGYPHNVPVEILLEQGLVGLLLFLGFVIGVMTEGFKILLNERVDQSSRLVLGLILCLFTFEGILLLKQGAFLGATSFFGIGIAAAIIFKQIRRTQRTIEEREKRQKQMLYPMGEQFGYYSRQPNQLH